MIGSGVKVVLEKGREGAWQKSGKTRAIGTPCLSFEECRGRSQGLDSPGSDRGNTKQADTSAARQPQARVKSQSLKRTWRASVCHRASGRVRRVSHCRAHTTEWRSHGPMLMPGPPSPH